MSKVTNKGQFSNQFRKSSTVTNPITTGKDRQPKSIQSRNNIGYNGGNDNNVYVYRKPNSNLNWSFTNGQKQKRCRKYGYNGSLWLEFEKEQLRDIGSNEILQYQRELYDKLKREYERGQRESTKVIEEITVKEFKRQSISECMAMNRHAEIVRLSCG